MRRISWVKNRRLIGVFFMMVITAGRCIADSSNPDSSNDFSADTIFKKSQEAYASLTSYSDEGTITSCTGSIVSATYTFHIKLGRANLYRIDWMRASSVLSAYLPAPKTKVLWSAGKGYFMDVGKGSENMVTEMGQSLRDLDEPKKEEMSLVLGLSWLGAPTDIPSAFFKLPVGLDVSDHPVSNEKRQADEKIGDVDCYVVSGEKLGKPRTFWIGKQDFLIRRIRNLRAKDVESANADNAAEAQIRQSIPNLPSIPKAEPEDQILTETHKNILVNQKLEVTDFER